VSATFKIIARNPDIDPFENVVIIISISYF
jgi:hypothetical protein